MTTSEGTHNHRAALDAAMALLLYAERQRRGASEREPGGEMEPAFHEVHSLSCKPHAFGFWPPKSLGCMTCSLSP